MKRGASTARPLPSYPETGLHGATNGEPGGRWPWPIRPGRRRAPNRRPIQVSAQPFSVQAVGWPDRRIREQGPSEHVSRPSRRLIRGERR